MKEDQPVKELDEVIKEREGAYLNHFERELEIMRKQVDEDDELIIEPFVDSVKEVCKAFAKEGFSGGSAPMYASVLASTIKSVLGFQILSPLLGDDSEWNDIRMSAGYVLFQNNRDSAVFKQEDGKCTYNNCIIWQGEESWDRFTGVVEGIHSKHYVREFPFMPKTFIVDVYREEYDPTNPIHQNLGFVETGAGKAVYRIKDEKQLNPVFEYYDKKEVELKPNKENNENEV